MKHIDELRDVRHMKTDRRFIKNVERTGGVFILRHILRILHFGELRDELQTLRLAAGKRGGGLSEREVAETDLFKQLKRPLDRRRRRKELNRLADLHLKDVAGALSLPEHFKRLRVEAFAAAAFAEHLYFRQEVHLNRPQSLAETGFAAAALGIEGEAARGVAAFFREARLRHDLPDPIPDADIRRGAGAGCLSDRCLINFQYPADSFPACDFTASGPDRSGVLCPQRVLEIPKKQVAAEAGFSGTYENYTNRGSQVVMFPLEYSESSRTVSLYEFWQEELSYAAADCAGTEYRGFYTLEGEFCWAYSTNAAVRCNLEKQDYTMIVSLGCTIPLKEIGQETYPVTVLVNGENAGTMVIDDTNNGQSVSLDISGDLLNEGANVITLQSELWSASTVNPADVRLLGIPLKNLEFAAA